jgi:hypothetical protein
MDNAGRLFVGALTLILLEAMVVLVLGGLIGAF